MAICWRRGVAPTRNPVFRSCDVLPALAVATATTAAIEIACTRWSTPVQPTATKIRHVPRSAARSEEHTSELQSLAYLVCRLLLEKKKKTLCRGVPVQRPARARIQATNSPRAREGITPQRDPAY